MITLFIGSPRKNGNTHAMARALFDTLEQAGHKVQTFHLYDQDIKPCIDCRACKKGDLVCVLKDDMATLYAALEASDIIVIGTPIYWFGPTSQTKAFLDRLRPYFANKKLTGKKAALLMPAGSGAGDCDLCEAMFRRSFAALGIDFLGAVTAEAYDVGDAETDQAVMSNIKKLGARLI